MPLYQAEDQSYLYYSKGALVMMAMHDLIGEEAINDALRGLLAGAGDPEDPPTSLDLIAELRRVTPAKHHEILDRWWKDTAVFDYKSQSAEFEALTPTVRLPGKTAMR